MQNAYLKKGGYFEGRPSLPNWPMTKVNGLTPNPNTPDNPVNE
jgi:hypothetical protein